MTQETKPTHVEEKVTERSIELTGDDSNAGTQAPQETQANNLETGKNGSEEKPDNNEKTDSVPKE